jgi:anti-sigma regulatory factor (Ser/Thr protein kinase)
MRPVRLTEIDDPCIVYRHSGYSPVTVGSMRARPTEGGRVHDPAITAPVARVAVAIGDESCLPLVRAELRELLSDVAPELVEDVELVCTELVTNAIEHAAAPRRLRVSVGGEVLRIEVDDGSPARLPVVGRSRLGPYRGRGLVLVAALASWGLDRDESAKTLWAELPAA